MVDWTDASFETRPSIVACEIYVSVKTLSKIVCSDWAIHRIRNRRRQNGHCETVDNSDDEALFDRSVCENVNGRKILPDLDCHCEVSLRIGKDVIEGKWGHYRGCVVDDDMAQGTNIKAWVAWRTWGALVL